MAPHKRRIDRRSLLKAAGIAGLGAAGVPLLGSCSSRTTTSGSAGSDGRLTLGTTQIMQFDPYLSNSALHIHAFYTYLVDYAGMTDYTPIPAGAEEWEVAKDNRSVTIKLRKGSYHSGAEVTAQDVVAGIRRAKDPEEGLTLAEPTAFVHSGTALDNRTVRVDFEQPTPEELVVDWLFAFPLVPADQNSTAKLETKPAGSGPFRLASYDRSNRLVLEKNPDYWDDGKPYLDEVEFRFFDDEDSLVAALEAGDIDGTAYIALQHADRLRGRFELFQGGGRMDLFFMNGAIPPFDNKQLRQALARAIDRDRIIEQVRFGMGEPIYTSFMPSSPAYDKAYLDSHSFDLAEAKRLLDASGGAKQATAIVGTEPGAEQLLQIIQADLKKIGFDLRIDPREETAFLEVLFSGKAECAVAAQPNNMQSPSLISRGRQMIPNTENVMMGDAIPDAYVAAVEAARTAIAPTEQRAAYAKLNEVLVDEAWAIGIATRPSLFALDSGINGLTTDPRDFVILTETKVA